MSDVLDLMWGELQDELSRQKAEAEVVLARSERAETAGGIESSTFANLPYHADGAHDGDLRFVTDACKSGEGVGTGTGTPCYFDEGTNTWKRVEDDAAPLAAGGGGGGGVASVTASSPIGSSGGANPNITLANPVPLSLLTDGATAGVPLLAGGGGGDPAYGQLDLTQTTAIKNQLIVANGGTGVATTDANKVFAGPTSGAAAAPAFRVLTAADLPAGVGAGLTVKNTSGGAATANDAGYIDANGEYKTTTTEALDSVAWCVVLTGGANNADIVVARAGRVTVVLNASCSIGDFLVTSTTAGRAKPLSIMHPACFARALTANAGGAGGTCSAILLTNTRFVSAANANNLYSVGNSSNTAFVATINGAPSSTSVVYNAPSSGAADSIVPQNSSLLLKARLYNLTRGTYRLIANVNIGTSTITTVASTDSWAAGDTLTIESQTAASGAAYKLMELDFTQQTAVPTLARAVNLLAYVYDTASTAVVWAHPFEAFAISKLLSQLSSVPFTPNLITGNIKIVNGAICGLCNASGSGTGNYLYRLLGYYLAEP